MPMNILGMRGLSTSGARRRSVAGALLAVFFLAAVPAAPAGAVTPSWKGAVADIEAIRDQAVATLLDLVGEYEDYLTAEPSAGAATEELAVIIAEVEEVAAWASDEIHSIIGAYQKAPQVQNSGWSALGTVLIAESSSIDAATLHHDEYIEGLRVPEISPSTTTTMIRPSVTTTTFPATTTTAPATTTTTTPVPTSTTTTAPASTTTSTSVAVGSNADNSSGGPPPASGDAGSTGPLVPIADSGGIGEAIQGGTSSADSGDLRPFGERPLSSVVRLDQTGITASLTRILEPALPTVMTDVVVSPLLIFELLWRAISSSGRGLVMPMSLLTFFLISLLWDRRSRRAPLVS